MLEKKNKNGYIVLFQGAKLTRVEANRVGLSIFFGLAGVILSVFILETKTKSIDYLVIIFFVIFGYLLSRRIFKPSISR
jgi:hypothetical protein